MATTSPTNSVAGPVRTGVGRTLRWPVEWLRGSVRRAPVTLGYLAVFWIAGAATGSLRSGPEGSVEDWVVLSAGSLPDHWPAVLLSAFWASGLPGYITGTLLVLVAGLACERVMGSAKFALVAGGTHIIGALLAIGFSHAALALSVDWSRALDSESFVGPVAFVCGAATAVSARLSTLWRRRLRVGLLTLLVLLALYGGSFDSICVLGAAAAGTVGGPLVFGRRPALNTGRPFTSRREARVLVALVVAASAVGPVISALSSQAVGPLAVLRYLFTYVDATDPQTVAQMCADPAQAADCHATKLQLRAGPAGFFLATLPQVLLVVFSDGLRRGRRFAWLAALILQALMTVLAGIRVLRYLGGADRGGHYELGTAQNALALGLPMIVPLLVLVLLAATRSLFTVSAPRGTYRRLAVWVAGAAALFSAVYVLGGLLDRDGFTPEATAGALIADLPQRFLPVHELSTGIPGLQPVSGFAYLLYEWVGVLFWVFTCVALLLSFLKPAHGRQARDDDRARKLLKAHGGGTMAWMTLWPGNTYWFAPGGNSYVAYRLNLGVALTVGAPVGPEEELRSTVEGFLAFCTSNGLVPCFYSVAADVEDITADLGYARLQVAEETVLPLGSLEFKGKKFQDVRTAMNHARKAGIEARWIDYPTAPLALLDQLHTISEEWVADKKMPEMGFTLGGLDEINDPDVRCLLAIDRDGTVHGVTSWLPIYRDGRVVGWTLDFMRRRSSGFRPVMDFLIASAASLLQEEGYELLSLSGAPLARSRGSGNSEAPLLDHVLDLLGATLEPVYGFRSLLAFKAKFQPRYVPLYLVYLDSASLPAIGNAVARAYLPEVSLSQSLTLVRRLMDGVR
ncbi:bifunctional lysylphosphatidylglycerol flippase/synthetase MprF [Arthrobacter sp. NPDC097144]|uniref:bifunctional lysylphosphatidylglycerol flippase/synthetase MprF n=1 Tax=Arthrobacter sp. NPDC097144 TaxID=3363946 RepID=UPI00382F70D8